MFDHRIRPLIDPTVNRLATFITKRGVTANQVTTIGFGLGMGAALSIAFNQYWLGLVLILVSRLADGLDGAVARANNAANDRGGFLDIVLDFIFYSSIPFAFAMADQSTNALAAAFLIWSFIGTGASFLAYAIIAEKRGLSNDARGRKSLFYLGGLTEGFETIAFLCLACVFPGWFAIMAWIFSALAWTTTATRIYMGWIDFKD